MKQKIKMRAFLFFVATLVCVLCIATKISNDKNKFEQMILIPAGETIIGNNQGFSGEMPEFKMQLDAFYLDAFEVTVADFRKFIEATDYITDAEKFGDAAVFDEAKKIWFLQKGATWHHPFGDTIAAQENHPVTQVSWYDANAYANWIGKRLPTEFEFEYASRLSQENKTTYNWGNALIENNQYKANTWQGVFPDLNLGTDGFLYTAPVGYFGKNKMQISDLGGNVWEWTSSWYQEYANIIQQKNDSTDFLKTIKGGSFMCDTLFCCGYRITARTGTSPETSLFHVGFRCAADPD